MRIQNKLLDEGDLIVTAGDDSNFIQGFGWSAIGLDIDGERANTWYRYWNYTRYITSSTNCLRKQRWARTARILVAI